MTLESSMDPTHKKHPKTHPTTTFNPTAAATAATTAAARGRRHTEQTAAVAASAAAVAAVAHSFPTQKPSSKLKFIQKVRPSSKPANPQPPPTAARRIDTRLQTKAMSLSAMADSSKELLAKPTRLHVTVIGEKKRDLKKTDSKEKLGKPSSKEKEKKDPIDVEKSFASLGLGGRKRFFGSSPVELRDFLSCNGVKIVSVDMPPLMQIHAVDCARKARDSLEKFTAKTLAQTLKKEFDGVYGPAWHCIVGTSFGSFVTHSVGGFLYFSMDQKLYVLLFKTTVQRAAD